MTQGRESRSALCISAFFDPSGARGKLTCSLVGYVSLSHLQFNGDFFVLYVNEYLWFIFWLGKGKCIFFLILCPCWLIKSYSLIHKEGRLREKVKKVKKKLATRSRARACVCGAAKWQKIWQAPGAHDAMRVRRD